MTNAIKAVLLAATLAAPALAGEPSDAAASVRRTEAVANAIMKSTNPDVLIRWERHCRPIEMGAINRLVVEAEAGLSCHFVDGEAPTAIPRNRVILAFIPALQQEGIRVEATPGGASVLRSADDGSTVTAAEISAGVEGAFKRAALYQNARKLELPFQLPL